MQQSNPNTLSHRRIAGNATFLVIRTVLSTLIGLFTSRVVLQVLGVEDYGLSAVAGSVVGMLNFLTGSLAGAGSRFITYEMGRGDADAMRRMFSATLFIQLGMAALILLLGETAGVWFLEYKLNIPPERMHAARWVYQLSIMSAALSVTQAPYSAIIMSYERMSIYAGFDILGMLLRLLIVYLLLILDGDKLITYATLGFAVSLAMLIINRAYCMKRFEECRGMPKFDKGATRSIFGYSMFTIISSFCVMICYSGTTFMINSFFGVVANAAVALAATIHGITMLFGANIQAAFRPQIVKQYAAGNSPTVWGLACMSVKFTMLIMSVLVVPCIIEAPVVLQFWLGQVPPLAVEFLRCMLAAGWLACISNQLDTVAYSDASIGRITFYKSCCFLANAAIIYILFRAGAPAWSAYVANGFLYVALSVAAVSVIRRLIADARPAGLVITMGKTMVVITLALLPVAGICLLMERSLLRLALIVALYAAAAVPLAMRIALSPEERAGVQSFIVSKTGKLFSAHLFKTINR
ncbi:MAG: lipopolysaccharide biosynthesis protein [Muribaculaceae bacterium]|nr:lipopolysaccharide biosynthesis protein [Muribaculaceae bacterium]